MAFYIELGILGKKFFVVKLICFMFGEEKDWGSNPLGGFWIFKKMHKKLSNKLIKNNMPLLS